ncbi:23S rRNA (adenine(2030)-N(6))-methyltransferase RlmJ [Alteromonas oceanisediminis]|uniref:23S rRNA (adenine(2030)-N(6))-methyltransferase RlmJ n=1 Tax=Alteromonas oceanisediminis TaxID=2836180 RepID=UPI001BD9FA52|nr:23S rRNA (adenine(2030)-N(6))-methyltransferase RlmJ [Alteromonas oceanisediminis]MBT0587134.1 23S rRNA (adenine(2030)-N(6))-methyltransferase RlmJ [Alteromonas oceanisediminis]
MLKHLCLLAAIQRFSIKSKPFCVFDTHAGAGSYVVNDEQVQLNGEFKTGLTRLVSQKETSIADDDPLLNDYISTLSRFQEQGVIPGSPVLAASWLRAQDALVAMELHPTEFEKLQNNLSTRALQENVCAQIALHHRDGFEGLVGVVPPAQKRGIVLIDPPYENASEYQAVYQTIEKVLKRWPTACILIWYPLLSQRAGAKSGRSEQLRDSLAEIALSGLFYAELNVSEKSADNGMFGSGVAVINPPWQFAETIAGALQKLAKPLSATSIKTHWLVELT